MLILQNLDFKNVQRRVYDALNVLSALDVINKDRNRITFKGYNMLLQQDCTVPKADP